MSVEKGDVMEDKNKQQEPQSLSKAVGCGSLLAAARKQQKKTVEEIAEELNLSVTQIRTIELDQSEGLPEPTYVRGYIRSYAKLLGLDAEEVLESYLHPNWQKTSSLDDIPRRIGNADDESTRFVTPAKVILLLVLAGVAGFLWWSGLLNDLMSTKPTPAPQTTVIESNETVVQTIEAPSVSVEPTGADTAVVEEPVEVSVATVDDEAQASEEPEVSVAAVVSNELTLKFTQTCWVDVRDNKDKRLAYKSYAAGEELTITNENKLHVFLGNAEGVSATYNGEPYDISSYREGVYAKFSLVKK